MKKQKLVTCYTEKEVWAEPRLFNRRDPRARFGEVAEVGTPSSLLANDQDRDRARNTNGVEVRSALAGERWR